MGLKKFRDDPTLDKTDIVDVQVEKMKARSAVSRWPDETTFTHTNVGAIVRNMEDIPPEFLDIIERYYLRMI